MTKREVSLQARLHAAHTFIGALKRDAKDYGSSFSAGVHVDCGTFLRDNKPVKEPNYVLVKKRAWIELRKQNLQLKTELRAAQRYAGII